MFCLIMIMKYKIAFFHPVLTMVYLLN